MHAAQKEENDKVPRALGGSALIMGSDSSIMDGQADPVSGLVPIEKPVRGQTVFGVTGEAIEGDGRQQGEDGEGGEADPNDEYDELDPEDEDEEVSQVGGGDNPLRVRAASGCCQG